MRTLLKATPKGWQIGNSKARYESRTIAEATIETREILRNI